MRRHLPSLDNQLPENLDGTFLVRVSGATYRYSGKAFLDLSFVVQAPQECAGTVLAGRLYCTPKALWKLHWFLRDFGYDAEMLSHGVLDDKLLIGLEGVVQVSRNRVHGRSCVHFDGFAPAAQWEAAATVRGDSQ